MIRLHHDGYSFSVVSEGAAGEPRDAFGKIGGPVGRLLFHHRGFVDPWSGLELRFLCYGRTWGAMSFRPPNQWDDTLRVLGLREKPFDDIVLVLENGSDEACRFLVDLITLLATCRHDWPLAYENYLAALDALNNDPDHHRHQKQKSDLFTSSSSRHRLPDQYIESLASSA